MVSEALNIKLLLPAMFCVSRGNMWCSLLQTQFYAVSASRYFGIVPVAVGLRVSRCGVGVPILICAFTETLSFPVALILVQCGRSHFRRKR